MSEHGPDGAIREIEVGILHWLEDEERKTPEEKRRDFMAFLRRTVDDMNAKPLQDRLRLLALEHEAPFESVAASVSDVSFELREDDPPEIIAHVRLWRPIEQVFVTVTIADS